MAQCKNRRATPGGLLFNTPERRAVDNWGYTIQALNSEETEDAKTKKIPACIMRDRVV
jgi:hypothetical protein